MDRNSMRALVEKAYAARDGGNVMGVVTAFHDDGVSISPATAKHLSWQARSRGVRASNRR
jgi:hypothetical protein